MKKGARIWGTLLLTFVMLLAAVPALADDYEDLPGQEVRVLLSGSSSANEYTITVGNGSYDIVSADHPSRILTTVYAGEKIIFKLDGAGSYSVETDDYYKESSSPFMAVPEDADDYFVFRDSSYRGCFKAIYSGSYYYAVNQINVELYLYGVVGRELGYGYNEDATMAQAVAARSYALANYSSANKYYDLTATTSSQVYGGKGAETAKIIKAVDDTCGYVLMYKGNYVQTYYSSNMGGYTENIENVWVSDAVPIKGVPSPHDAWAGNYSSYGASTYSWSVEYTPEQLVALANKYAKTDIGEYTGISYSDTLSGVKSVSGRAMTLTISGTKGSVTATKDNIRSLLNLKSTLITVTDNTSSRVAGYVMGSDGRAIAFSSLDDVYAIAGGNGIMKANGSEKTVYAIGGDGMVPIDKKGGSGNTVTIQGKGYGHGVGLSQFGAIGMGDDGYSWDEIIRHYFCTGNDIRLERAY